MSQDFIQDQPAPQGAAAQPAPPDAAQPPQPDAAQPQPGQEVLPPSPDGEQRPVGTANDLIQADQDADPTNSEAVTPQEQRQYDDLVRRALLFISDDRKPGGTKKSPLESTLAMLNDPKKSVPDAVGFTAANVMRTITNAAKRAKQPYSPDVIFHGGYELTEHLYALGASNKLFNGVPEIKFDPKDENHEWSPEEQKIIDTAFATGVQYFGQYLKESGQITPEYQDASKKFWNEQIAREVTKGEVPDSEFDKLDVNGMRAQMQQRINQQPQLVES